MNPYIAEMEKQAAESDRSPLTLGERMGITAMSAGLGGGLLYQAGERHPAWLASAAAVPAGLALLAPLHAPRPENQKPVIPLLGMGATLGAIGPLTRPLYDEAVTFKGSVPKVLAGAALGATIAGGMGYVANRASRRAYGEGS